MAEYMDYNDYDYGYSTKKKRIFANIRLVVAIVLLLSIVLWVVFREPENIRTDFSSVLSSPHKISEEIKGKNEILNFANSFDIDDTENFSEEFKKNYPTIYNWLYTPKAEIAKNKVKTFDSNGYFAIASTYQVQRDKDTNGAYFDENKKYLVGTTGLDIYLFRYDTKDDFTVHKPEKISVYLHNGKDDVIPYIERVHIPADRFRLNFYSMSVVVESEEKFNFLDTQLTLESGINKKQYESEYFSKIVFLNGKSNTSLLNEVVVTSGGKRADAYIEHKVECSTDTEYACVGLKFEDELYNKFESFSVKNLKGATYKIKIN